MDEDLKEVKEQLDQLSETLEQMKDTRRGQEESTGTGGTRRSQDTVVEEDSDPGEDSHEPEMDGPDSGETGLAEKEKQDDDPHPTDIERFRDKLDHGHEAANKEHFREAQRIYRSLIQEYRRLKQRNELTDDDEQRLHTLYEKVNRAKE